MKLMENAEAIINEIIWDHKNNYFCLFFEEGQKDLVFYTKKEAREGGDCVDGYFQDDEVSIVTCIK